MHSLHVPARQCAIQKHMLSEGATPERFCADVAALLGAEQITLCLVRHKRLQLVPAFSTEPARLTEDACRSPGDESLRLALETSEPVKSKNDNGRALLLTSVSSHGETLGVIEAVASERRTFTESDAALLAHVTPLAAPLLRERWQQLFEGTHGLSPSERRSSRPTSPATPRRVPSILKANSVSSCDSEEATRATAGVAAAVGATEDAGEAAGAPSPHEVLELVSDLARLSGSNEQMIRQIRAAAKEAVRAADSTCNVM